ncbi:MAG: hypothetical protein QM699_04795 [Amaricoccus sp.]|uniref:hypothetical protein n=1 Tax=Amaricoccus sp. TaxID=1872485 RepID=UPI0039E3E1DC
MTAAATEDASSAETSGAAAVVSMSARARASVERPEELARTYALEAQKAFALALLADRWASKAHAGVEPTGKAEQVGPGEAAAGAA